MPTFRERSTRAVLLGLLLAAAYPAHPASAQPSALPFNPDQAQATARVWLSADALTLTDRSGNRFVKQGVWEVFQGGGGGLGFGPAPETDYSLTVEGSYASAADPAAARIFSGPAVFRFNRADDGRWFLRKVLLGGVTLASEAEVEVLAAARVRGNEPTYGQPSGQRVKPLTQDEAQAAVSRWLARKLPLGSRLMKDPGGEAEVFDLRDGAGIKDATPMAARIRFAKVPYHGPGAPAGAQTYSGAGEVSFWFLNDGGGWNVQQVYLLDLQTAWTPRDASDRIRLPASFATIENPGEIRGRVLDVETRMPIAGAAVNLDGTRTTTSAADGTFLFAGLPEGGYSLQATAAGYAESYSNLSSKRLRLGPGDRLTRTLLLLPPLRLEGRIADHAGAPVRGVRVHILEAFGGHLLSIGQAMTDEAGRYAFNGRVGVPRMSKTPDGSAGYTVFVAVDAPFEPDGPVTDLSEFRRVFYPGVTRADEAKPVVVPGRRGATGIDFTASAPARRITVRGVVTDQSGTRVTEEYRRQAEAAVLFSPDPSLTPFDAFQAELEPDGSFQIAGVAPGTYLIRAVLVSTNPADSRGGPFMSALGIASVPVVVTDHDQQVPVVVPRKDKRPAEVRGRVIVAPGDSGAPPLGTFVFQAMAATVIEGIQSGVGVELGQFTTAADGSFVARQLVGSVAFAVQEPSGWRVQAVRRAGVEYKNGAIDLKPDARLDGVEIVVTNQRATGELVETVGLTVSALSGTCPALRFAASGLAGPFQTSGALRVATDASTTFDDLTCESVKDGSTVGIEGTADPDGTVRASAVTGPPRQGGAR